MEMEKTRTLIGDKAFYKRTFAVAIPIMIQNVITNFVNLLDNLMVGGIGTEQMSGVEDAIRESLGMEIPECVEAP